MTSYIVGKSRVLQKSDHLFLEKEKRAHHKPLRTIVEMAEEFGVSRRTLAKLISSRGGPAPQLKTENKSAPKATWYEPHELRAWWKNIHP